MDQATFELLLGLLLPLIAGVVKRDAFSNVVNSIIAIVVYVVCGVVFTFLSGAAWTFNATDPTSFLGIVTVFVGAGTIGYNLFWKALSNTMALQKRTFLGWPR